MKIKDLKIERFQHIPARFFAIKLLEHDTAAMQLSRGGVATALFSIPNRYMHSQVEMCDLRDAWNTINLLTETIAAMKGDESFIPVI